GDLKQKFPGHTRSVTSLAFSLDSRFLASAGLDRMLKIWDCHTYELKKMASDQMLSIEEMQTISDATSSKSGKNAMPPVSWLNALSFSRDGKQIIGGGGDSIIRFYESESVKLVDVLKPRGWPFLNTIMTFYDPRSSSGLPTSDIDIQNPIIHRGLNSGMGFIRLGRWPSHPGLLNSMALSPDGKTLAIGICDGNCRLLTLKETCALLNDHLCRFANSRFDL